MHIIIHHPGNANFSNELSPHIHYNNLYKKDRNINIRNGISKTKSKKKQKHTNHGNLVPYWKCKLVQQYCKELCGSLET